MTSVSDSTAPSPTATALDTPEAIASALATYTESDLAQALAAKLAIAPHDWHRLKGHRPSRAKADLASAMVYLLSDRPDEALAHLQQASGWLDRSISAPPCPSHGNH
jgi:hypothetical protein